MDAFHDNPMTLLAIDSQSCSEICTIQLCVYNHAAEAVAVSSCSQALTVIVWPPSSILNPPDAAAANFCKVSQLTGPELRLKIFK